MPGYIELLIIIICLLVKCFFNVLKKFKKFFKLGLKLLLTGVPKQIIIYLHFLTSIKSLVAEILFFLTLKEVIFHNHLPKTASALY